MTLREKLLSAFHEYRELACRVKMLEDQLRSQEPRLSLAKETMARFRASVRKHVNGHRGKKKPVVGCVVCDAVVRKAWERDSRRR